MVGQKPSKVYFLGTKNIIIFNVTAALVLSTNSSLSGEITADNAQRTSNTTPGRFRDFHLIVTQRMKALAHIR